MGKHLVPVFQFHSEHGTRQDGSHFALDFNNFRFGHKMIRLFGEFWRKLINSLIQGKVNPFPLGNPKHKLTLGLNLLTKVWD